MLVTSNKNFFSKAYKFLTLSYLTLKIQPFSKINDKHGQKTQSTSKDKAKMYEDSRLRKQVEW